MKLKHILEATERSQHGNTPPGDGFMSFEDAVSKLEELTDSSTILVEDVEVIDPMDGGTTYDTTILVEISDVQHAKPDRGADNPDDYNGYTDFETTVVGWVQADEDGEQCKPIHSSVELTENGSKHVNDVCLNHVEDGINNPDVDYDDYDDRW